MIRGTTPTIRFGVPFDPSTAKKIWITFSQNGEEVFTISEEDCTFEGNEISSVLTQANTLMLNDEYDVEIQLRVSFDGDDFDKAIASDIITRSVGRILKDGEI
jgi:hypothetical protein